MNRKLPAIKHFMILSAFSFSSDTIRPMIMPMIAEKLTRPLHIIACAALKLEFIRIDALPISYGISWAKIAMIVETTVDRLVEEKATPRAIPSIILCKKSPIWLRNASGFLFLHPFVISG